MPKGQKSFDRSGSPPQELEVGPHSGLYLLVFSYMSFSFFNGNRPNYLLVRLFCISFLHVIGFCCIKLPFSIKHARKKYNIAKMTNNLAYFHCKKIHLIKDSSKEYCCNIYQIEALAKTFLLNIVFHLGILCCNLQLQSCHKGVVRTNMLAI